MKKVSQNVLTIEGVLKYVNDHRKELSQIDGECGNCPLRRECKKAHHVERIQAILAVKPEDTRYPQMVKLLKKFPFLLYAVPRFIFKFWREYDNNPLGCPSVGIANNIDKIEKSYNLITEEKSRQVYLGVIMFRVTFDLDYLAAISSQEAEYFEIFHDLSAEEVVIDGGGYIGDTLIEYLKRNTKPAKYIIYEPDEINIDLMKQTIGNIASEDFFLLRQMGIGEKLEKLWLKSNLREASYVVKDGENADISIDITSIDVERKQLQLPVTFIKLDIEGMELSGLKGAVDTIKECAPKLAICLYHKPSDLWNIPIYISEIKDTYKNYIVRHYCQYGWTDTIIYVF